jgi:dUTPase
MSEIPKYFFALREDLTDDKRFLPTKAEPKASGWDVRAAMLDRQPLWVRPFDVVKIPLGIRGFCPDGWWYDLKPRSSTFTKKNLHALYGTIDETYEGELVFACQYLPPIPFKTNWDRDGLSWDEPESWDEWWGASSVKIEFGDAIGQIIPRRRDEMNVVEITNEQYNNSCKARSAIRGTGGFGSTGK